MATLFRQPGSPYWYTAFFDGTGRRLRRSTKQRKRSEAVGVAAQMEKLARRRAKPREDENSAEIYRILEDAGTQALRGKLNASNAREFLNKILEVSADHPIDNPSLEEWLRGWLEEKKGARAEGTYQRYAVVVDAFLEFLPARKRKAPLASLSSADIRSFRNLLKEGGRTATTVNMAVKILRTPLNLARKQGYLSHNPADAVEMLKTEVQEKETFTSKQVAAMVKAAKGDWKGLILAGYYTGARISDLSNLQWESVDLQRKTIAFVQAKTGRNIEIPIHPQLEICLKEIPHKSREGYVFPSLAGKTAAGRNGLSGQFRLIMKKAKVQGKTIERDGEGGRNRSTLSFHSLRHSFNSEMANAGIPQEMRQRLTGHASKAVNDRYTHAELATLRRAVESVPAL